MALATRCPHCETVFKLDQHLLAPHDGRVRCGHCQEVFDAAHHRFELPDEHHAHGEAQHAAIVDDDVAIGPSSPASPPAPAVKQEAELPTITTPAPVAPPAPPAAPAPAPVRPTVAAPRTLDVGASLAGRPAPRPPSAPTPPTPPTPPKTSPKPPVSAPSDDSDRTEYAGASASAGAPAPVAPQPAAPPSAQDHERVKQFVRVNPPQEERAKPVELRTPPPPPPPPSRPVEPPRNEPSPFIDPVDDRAEPFIGPTHGRTTDTPSLRAVPSPSPAPSPAPAPAPAPAPSPAPAAAGWRDDAEPGFGAHAPGVEHPDSANEAFPVTREPRPAPTPARGAPGPRRGLRIASIVLAVLLAIVLLAQLAWWQREEVMVLVPGTHKLYTDVCDEFGCSIAPPRDIDGLQIESSGLRQVDGPHKLELKLSLRNRLDVALAYPALELTLLDDKNNVAIRRVLWPQDYARPGTIFAIGLPPQSAQPVVIRLDTGDAVAANYRVQVFYP
jgi:predicted Zn finger-like uncharacterized protein